MKKTAGEFRLTLALALFLSGCAASPMLPTGQERQAVHRVSGVPFFSDDGNQCGLSSLAGLLTYWGYPATPAALRKEFAFTKLDGSRLEDLAKAAQARKLRAEVQSGSPEILHGELESGRPVLVELNLGFGFLPRKLYAVVTGYDDLRGGFFIHSGAPNRFVTKSWLFSRWKKAKFLWIRVRPDRS